MNQPFVRVFAVLVCATTGLATVRPATAQRLPPPSYEISAPPECRTVTGEAGAVTTARLRYRVPDARGRNETIRLELTLVENRGAAPYLTAEYAGESGLLASAYVDERQHVTRIDRHDPRMSESVALSLVQVLTDERLRREVEDCTVAALRPFWKKFLAGLCLVAAGACCLVSTPACTVCGPVGSACAGVLFD